jgi:alkylated DNA nucleotide flippase Atl1
VARACARNPVAVVIPCHRVVEKSGELGGYRWGVARKRTLLQREAETRRESAASMPHQDAADRSAADSARPVTVPVPL